MYIYELSIFKIQPIKKINVLTNLRNLILANGCSSDLAKLDWLFIKRIQEFKDTVDTKFVINDKMHVCVRLNRK